MYIHGITDGCRLSGDKENVCFEYIRSAYGIFPVINFYCIKRNVIIINRTLNKR